MGLQYHVGPPDIDMNNAEDGVVLQMVLKTSCHFGRVSATDVRYLEREHMV